MASGVRLFAESVHHQLAEMQTQLRLSSYADNLTTAQPFTFSNTTTTTPLWSHVNFIPEKIVDLSVTMDGLRFYRVQWCHSWVAEHQLLPFQHVLQDFWTKEKEVSTKSNTTLKQSFMPKQGSTDIPTINKLSSKSTIQKQKGISSAADNMTAKAVPMVEAPEPITRCSTVGERDGNVLKVFMNNESSDKSGIALESEDKFVNPTLAADNKKDNGNLQIAAGTVNTPVDNPVNTTLANTVNPLTGNTVNTAIGNTVNTFTGNTLNTAIDNTVNVVNGDTVQTVVGNTVNTANNTVIGITVNGTIDNDVNTEDGDLVNAETGNRVNEVLVTNSLDTSTSAEQSKQKKSYEEISKIAAFKLKHERFVGRSVECDGLDILGVENANVTDDMARAQAREIVASFKKKRRKYENGKSYWDPHPCFFCKKVLSNGKRLRYHNFQIHLKHFGQIQCDVCQQRFFYGRDLKAHKRMHSEERDWVCEICQAVFKFSNGLYKHMSMHKKESNFRCDVCHANFKLQAELRTHCMEEHKSDNLTCTVCKAKLRSGYSVYMHSLRHSGTRDHKCDECGRSFKRKAHLVEHKKTHSDKKNMECPVCKRKVSGRAALVTHVTKFHAEYATACKAKFKCNICDKPFIHKGKLGIHMKLKHANETREQYQQRNLHKNRGKRIQKARNVSHDELVSVSEKVEKVTNVKTGEVRLRCKLCGQTYLIVSWMKKHLEDHRNGKLKRRQVHVCKNCDVKFKSKYHLLKHRQGYCGILRGIPKIVSVEDIHANVQKITDSSGKIKFKCKICPRREFQLVRALKRHLQEHRNHNVIEIHKKQEEHLCEDCHKSFKTKKRLQLHQKISHQKSDTSTNSRSEADLSSMDYDENRLNLDNHGKRKQLLPMKFPSRGKRDAALNAKSILHLQVHEISSGDEDEVEIVEENESDYEPC